MQDQWTYRSGFQPTAGKPIEFRLEDFGKPRSGIFTDDVFHSRCANSGQSRVGSWHSPNGAPSASPMGETTSGGSPFSRIVSRMKSLISRSHGPDHTMSTHHQSRMAAMAATPWSATNVVVRDIHSNQMSS